MNDKEFLEHFGILGMKWGKRKKQTDPSKNSEDHNVKEILKTKKPNELSNAELKKLTERMQLEKSYRELQTTNMSAGRKFATDFIVTNGKRLLTDYLTKQLNEGVASLVNRNTVSNVARVGLNRRNPIGFRM